MALDPALLKPILDAGETPATTLLTSGVHVFVDADGSEVERPIWVIATDRRCWVAAADTEHAWHEAWGSPTEVELLKGWTRDGLRVGTWHLPLRAGSRPAAATLVERFASVGDGGERVVGSVPLGKPRGDRARGALGIPDWVAPELPAEADERWLFGFETAATHPFNHRNGTVVREPLLLLLSDQRLVLAARAEWGELFVEPADSFAWTSRRTGRDTLQLNRRSLPGPLISGDELATLDRLYASKTRWETAAAVALERGDPKRALLIWDEALYLGRPGAFLADVAQLLLATDQASSAVSALAAHLVAHPDTELDHGQAHWRAHNQPLRKAANRASLDWSRVGAALRDRLAALDDATPPAGLAWPPSGISEVWACALTQAGSDKAADAWRACSASWREASRNEEANAALKLAVSLDASGRDHWQLAEWAWTDGNPEGASAHWTEALGVDPLIQDWIALPPAAVRQVVALATGESRSRLYALLLALVPEDRDARDAWAHLLEHELDDPKRAAEVLETGAELDDARGSEDLRFPRWIDIGRLYALADDQEQAREALHQAIRGDFLHPEAYRQALDCPGVDLPPALATWWTHLWTVLTPEVDTAHSPLVTQFDEDELDALHPGGVGWLDNVRTRVDTKDPPERTTLIRGLERMSAEEWPREHAVLTRVCAALDLAVPETRIYRGDAAWGLSAWPVSPPVLLIGVEHLRDGPRQLDDEALAIAMAIELVHLKCAHPLLAFDSSLVGTSTSVYAAFGEYAGTAENVVDLLTLVPGVDQIAKLQTVLRLSRKVFTARSTLDKATSVATPVIGWFGTGSEDDSGIGREGLKGAALQFRLHADRVGLLLVGDLRAAIAAILRASTTSLEQVKTFEEDGAVALLGRASLSPDEGLRISALLEFAAQWPLNGHSKR
ncbi:MAG: hypothetical protein KC912_10665 [Proteobacteria bacterium]|nr:hypothetical protein [Pseudomonadota bacterium]